MSALSDEFEKWWKAVSNDHHVPIGIEDRHVARLAWKAAIAADRAAEAERALSGRVAELVGELMDNAFSDGRENRKTPSEATEAIRVALGYAIVGAAYAIADKDAPPAAPVVPDGMVLVPADVVEFLHGAAPLDGVWFGDRHPTERGAFWWRKKLAAAPAPSQDNGGAA